jgi:hypothetical protein
MVAGVPLIADEAIWAPNGVCSAHHLCDGRTTKWYVDGKKLIVWPAGGAPVEVVSVSNAAIIAGRDSVFIEPGRISTSNFEPGRVVRFNIETTFQRDYITVGRSSIDRLDGMTFAAFGKKARWPTMLPSDRHEGTLLELIAWLVSYDERMMSGTDAYQIVAEEWPEVPCEIAAMIVGMNAWPGQEVFQVDEEIDFDACLCAKPPVLAIKTHGKVNFMHFHEQGMSSTISVSIQNNEVDIMLGSTDQQTRIEVPLPAAVYLPVCRIDVYVGETHRLGAAGFYLIHDGANFAVYSSGIGGLVTKVLGNFPQDSPYWMPSKTNTGSIESAFNGLRL